MSRVHLIAADKPLPLRDRQAERTSTTKVSGREYTISFVRGFRVAEHTYYRHAVDILNYPIKPYQYELAIELHEDDLRHLTEYLAANFSPGETVELWSIWVGIDSSDRPPPHYTGTLADFDMDTLEQFLKPENASRRHPGQCRMTITI